MVGLVESTGSWWLSRRTMSREKVVELLCECVWHLIDGTVRANNLVIGYDEPLPIEALARQQTIEEHP